MAHRESLMYSPRASTPHVIGGARRKCGNDARRCRRNVARSLGRHGSREAGHRFSHAAERLSLAIAQKTTSVRSHRNRPRPRRRGDSRRRGRAAVSLRDGSFVNAGPDPSILIISLGDVDDFLLYGGLGWSGSPWTVSG